MASAEGRLTRKGGLGIITVSNKTGSLGRYRFTVGHELGHFELHGSEMTFKECTPEDINDWSGTKRFETEANQFSAELLMPYKLFEPLCIGPPSIKMMLELASGFQTSLTATTIRYMQIEREPCAVVYAESGKIKWRLNNKDFWCKIKKVGSLLDQDTYAYDGFNGKEITNESNPVDTASWIEDEKVDPESNIWESSFYSRVFNSTLTLLWMKEEIGR